MPIFFAKIDVFLPAIRSYFSKPILHVLICLLRPHWVVNQVFLSNINTNGQAKFLIAYPIDEETLKLICDAEEIGISLIGCSSTIRSEKSDDWTRYAKKFDIRDLDTDDLATYAQVFYRSIVDNKAYPDAAISEFKYPKAAKKIFGKLKNFFDD